MYLAVFRSRNQALRFQQALSRAGIDSQAITTPASLNLGCGLSITIHEKDKSRAERVLSCMQLNAFALWHKS